MSITDKIRKIPGLAAAEGALNGAVATERDLPIKDYDRQSVEDIASKLKGFSQRELRMIDAYGAQAREPLDDPRQDRKAHRRGAVAWLRRGRCRGHHRGAARR